MHDLKRFYCIIYAYR